MSAQGQKPKWALHFQIDDGTWANLTAQSLRAKLTPLECAIEMRVINQESFLSWDRDTSKTPALKMDFFNSPPPIQLFQKFDYLQCRQKTCMPVTEWGGNIYWAKLSSEQTGFEDENSKPFWFLAPWSGLKKWFEVWKAQTESLQENPKGEIILGEEFQPFEFGGAGVQVQEPHEVSESKSFTGTELRTLNPEAESHNKVEVEIEISKSIELDMTQPTVVEPRAETIILEEPSEPSIKTIKPLRPETSSKAIDPKVFAPRPAMQEDLVSSVKIQKAQGKAVEPPTGLNQFNPEVTAAIDFSSLLGAPLPPLPMTKEETTPLPPTPGEKPLTSPGALDPISKLKAIATIPIDQFESRMRLATTQNGLAETFMGVWQNYFQQVMVLFFQNNELCIWWHNYQFLGQCDREKAIPLDTPSVFKIVADTGHPYHGYVSRGPANDQFFQLANNGQYPEHLTIVPVLSGDRVVAMLLGLCSQEAAKGIVLSKLQEDARVFSNSLTRISSPIKKVA